jgi:hypothetical protein
MTLWHCRVEASNDDELVVCTRHDLIDHLPRIDAVRKSIKRELP